MRKTEISLMFLFILLIAAFTFITGCTTANVQTTLQGQLTAFCAMAPAEVAAFQSAQSTLSAKAQEALPIVSQGVTTLCAPGVVASAVNLQTFGATVLPAFTIIALEVAAQQKK